MEIAARFPHSHNLDDGGDYPLNPSAYGVRILRARSDVMVTQHNLQSLSKLIRALTKGPRQAHKQR